MWDELDAGTNEDRCNHGHTKTLAPSSFELVPPFPEERHPGVLLSVVRVGFSSGCWFSMPTVAKLKAVKGPSKREARLGVLSRSHSCSSCLALATTGQNGKGE